MKTKNILTLIVAAGLTSLASSAFAVSGSYAPLLTQSTTVLNNNSIIGIGNYFGGSVTADVTTSSAFLYIDPGYGFTYIDGLAIFPYGDTTWTFSSTITEFTLGWAAPSDVSGFNYEVFSTASGSIASGTVSTISYDPSAASYLHYSNAAGFNSVTISNPEGPYALGYGTGVIPEPSTYGLIGLGALGVAFVARRRKAKVA